MKRLKWKWLDGELVSACGKDGFVDRCILSVMFAMSGLVAGIVGCLALAWVDSAWIGMAPMWLFPLLGAVSTHFPLPQLARRYVYYGFDANGRDIINTWNQLSDSSKEQFPDFLSLMRSMSDNNQISYRAGSHRQMTTEATKIQVSLTQLHDKEKANRDRIEREHRESRSLAARDNVDDFVNRVEQEIAVISE